MILPSFRSFWRKVEKGEKSGEKVERPGPITMNMPIGTNRWTTFQICAGRKNGVHGHHRREAQWHLESSESHFPCFPSCECLACLNPQTNQETLMGFLRTPIRRINPSFSPMAGQACFLHSWDQEHREQAPCRPENSEWQSSGQTKITTYSFYYMRCVIIM